VGFGLPLAGVQGATLRHTLNVPTAREDETIRPVIQAGD